MTPHPPSTLSHARRVPFPAAFEIAEEGADSSHAARQAQTLSHTHTYVLTQPWKEWKKVLKYHMPDIDEAKLKDVFKEIDQDQVWLRDGTDGEVTLTG